MGAWCHGNVKDEKETELITEPVVEVPWVVYAGMKEQDLKTIYREMFQKYSLDEEILQRNELH